MKTFFLMLDVYRDMAFLISCRLVVSPWKVRYFFKKKMPSRMLRGNGEGRRPHLDDQENHTDYERGVVNKNGYAESEQPFGQIVI